jgi:hypothetical protein
MGACQSSNAVVSKQQHHDLHHIDDSIHILLKRDIDHAKKHGIELSGYRPRTPHPLLVQREQEVEQQRISQAAAMVRASMVVEEQDDHEFSAIIRKNIIRTSQHGSITTRTETESTTEQSVESIIPTRSTLYHVKCR